MFCTGGAQLLSTPTYDKPMNERCSKCPVLKKLQFLPYDCLSRLSIWVKGKSRDFKLSEDDKNTELQQQQVTAAASNSHNVFLKVPKLFPPLVCDKEITWKPLAN